MDVFVSYSRRDAAHAIALNDWLTDQHVATFFDQRDLPSGQLWLPELEKRIAETAQSVIVLIGPAGLGNTQQYEYQLALTRQAGEPGFPVIPVILPETPDWRIPRGFLGLQTWVDFRASIKDPVALQRLLAAVRRVPVTDDGIRGTICPYKGLEFFSEEDAPLFFGRDAEAGALKNTVTKHNVAALIGRSGSGKSSLVRAGLLPRLRRAGERRGGGDVWDSLVIRPGQEPLQALASAFTPIRSDEDPMDRTRRLMNQAEDLRRDSPDFLAQHVQHRLTEARLHVDRLLIVVDQAEELFSVPWDRTTPEDIQRFHDDGAQFIRLLLGAAERGKASVVLTIRSDFYDHLMHSPFAPHLSDALVRLTRIQDLRPCIEQPAAMVGLKLADGLTDQIVGEVGAEETNLPLMQHALERTWRNRSGSVLTHDAYQKAGGVAQAINQAASDCYASLRTDQDRDAARRLFLRLVRPGVGGANVRMQAPAPTDVTALRVMERFADPSRRLLLIDEKDSTRVVELAHEALVRGWDTLRGWVENSRDNLRIRDQITDWMSNAKGGLLPPGTVLLQSARALAADPGDVHLDAEILRYIVRSTEAEDAQAQAEAEQQARTEAYAQAAQNAASDLVFNIAISLEDQQGISTAAVSRILDTAMGVIDRMLLFRPDDPALLRIKAAASAQFADTYGRIGEIDRQKGMAEQSLSIAKRLSDAAPNDEGYQRDLSVSHKKLGDVLVAQGNLTEALTAYRATHTILERLAQADPGNAGWQRDLSVSHDNLGDVLVAQGNLTEALTAYRASLAIRERLAQADPGNAGWQHDLGQAHAFLVYVHRKLAQIPEAREHLVAGRAILVDLVAKHPEFAQWKKDLAWFDGQLAALK